MRVCVYKIHECATRYYSLNNFFFLKKDFFCFLFFISFVGLGAHSTDTPIYFILIPSSSGYYYTYHHFVYISFVFFSLCCSTHHIHIYIIFFRWLFSFSFSSSSSADRMWLVNERRARETAKEMDSNRTRKGWKKRSSAKWDERKKNNTTCLYRSMRMYLWLENAVFLQFMHFTTNLRRFLSSSYSLL